MDLLVLAQAAEGVTDTGVDRRQVDRPRGRRRARLDRSRDRHRDHLRQGDRVRRPPARAEGRAAVDPLARLRAHRGGRLLHLHLRADRLLPLGTWSCSATSASFVLAQAEGGARARRRAAELPGLARARADDLDAARASGSRCWVLKRSRSRASARRSRSGANAIREKIEASEKQREEADKLLAEYRQRLKEAREQAEDIVARARKAAEAAEARGDRRGQGQARGAGRRGAQGHRDRDPALARADPQGGRRPDRARDREGDPQVARRRRPEAPRRGGARRGRLLRAGRSGGDRERGWRVVVEEIARVYADALFEVAKQNDKLDEIREQLGRVRRRARGRARPSDLLLQPVLLLGREARGDRARDLGRRGRARQLPRAAGREAPDAGVFRIRGRFDELWAEENQRLEVTLTSAVELDDRSSSRSARRSSARPIARSSSRARSTRTSSAGSCSGSATWCSTRACAASWRD